MNGWPLFRANDAQRGFQLIVDIGCFDLKINKCSSRSIRSTRLKNYAMRIVKRNVNDTITDTFVL